MDSQTMFPPVKFLKFIPPLKCVQKSWPGSYFCYYSANIFTEEHIHLILLTTRKYFLKLISFEKLIMRGVIDN